MSLQLERILTLFPNSQRHHPYARSFCKAIAVHRWHPHHPHTNQPMSAVGISSGPNTSETPSSDQLGFPGLLDNSDLQPKSARADSRITAPTSAERLNAVLEELSHLNVTGSIEIEKPIATAGGGYCDVFIGYVRRLGGPNRVKVAVRQLRTFIMLERDFKKVRPQLDSLFNMKLTALVRCSRKNSNSGRHYVILTYFLSMGSQWLTKDADSHSSRSGWRMEEPTSLFKPIQTIPSNHWLVRKLVQHSVILLHILTVLRADPRNNKWAGLSSFGKRRTWRHESCERLSGVSTFFTTWTNNAIQENVLISDTFQPLICDFGISSRAIMTSNALAVSSTLSGNHLAGSLRWMACELLLTDPDQPDIVPQHTRKTDVWPFGMTVYVRSHRFYALFWADPFAKELITGQVPFAHIPPSLNPLVLSNIKGCASSSPRTSFACYVHPPFKLMENVSWLLEDGPGRPSEYGSDYN